ncbi:MAG: sel1 repeat family protein [Phaeovulum sp.]|uniref:sel1 repeat family protein n=1 Tax=Phaeovulum sp. TaxID=2934796 RepID=UPI0027310C61|nr:sel1 repeat family protein [Phaeovulum sp.]MDP2063699.1 sel1 repeat family protein [Phaeovulum sp.]
MRKAWLPATIFTALLGAQDAAADLAAGLAAYTAGDTATAPAEWAPLAAAGDREAQFRLGILLEYGRGVPQDPAEAARLYRLAAAQGHVLAQRNLATLLHLGRVLARDPVRAQIWARIAADAGDSAAAALSESIAATMTEPDLAEAQRRARACLASGYLACE